MCGRYEFLLKREAILEYYGIEESLTEFEILESEEVFPSQMCHIIFPNKELSKAKWGLDEAWAKRAIINTRLETADQKKTTAEAFRQRRCIIPASAFFEWDANKHKIHIHVAEQPIISLAGLYNFYQSEEGKIYTGFSILTKAANAQIANIHDRMPVILPEQFTERYLDLSSDINALKKSLMRFDQAFVFTDVSA